MDGERDKATLQYEREIRIGMVLLGGLATVFIVVLAVRIWGENRQNISATKKPIYLTKAQRDDLRAKTKPRSLASLNASTPMRRLRSSSAAQSEPAVAEADPAEIPELEIGETESGASPSQPANFTEQDRATGNEPAYNSAPSRIEAKPIEPEEDQQAEKSLSPSESEATPPSESTPIEETPDESHGEAELNADSSKPPEVAVKNAPGDEDPSTLHAAAPLPLPPSPIEASPLNAPEYSISRKNSEETSDKLPAAGGEIVRKKVNKNPWKRPRAPQAEPGQVQYTVQSGDTLKSIAHDLLGDESHWQEIYDLNRAEIGDDFSFLRKGLKLTLPKASEAAPPAVDPDSKDAKIELPSVLKK